MRVMQLMTIEVSIGFESESELSFWHAEVTTPYGVGSFSVRERKALLHEFIAERVADTAEGIAQQLKDVPGLLERGPKTKKLRVG